MSKQHPILFSREMVRAILYGRKTQNRRIVKQDPAGKIPFTNELPCPYGLTGDILWVRETFASAPHGFVYKASYPDDWFGSQVVDMGTGEMIPLVWKPSIHMPRAACRIELEITELRIERLNSISESDAIAEGCQAWTENGQVVDTAVSDFSHLWDAINLSRGFGWDKNPWVWVVKFKLPIQENS